MNRANTSVRLLRIVSDRNNPAIPASSRMALAYRLRPEGIAAGSTIGSSR